MLRKKNARDPIGSLELGGAAHISRSFRVKKIGYKKVLKYVILIILGVALHSIYREIFQAHNIEEVKTDKELQKDLHKQEPDVHAPPDIKPPPEVKLHNAEPPGGRVLDNNDNGAYDKETQARMKQISDDTFQAFDEVHAKESQEENKHEQQNQNEHGEHSENGINHEQEVVVKQGGFAQQEVINEPEVLKTEFDVEEDHVPFQTIVDLKEDAVENQSNIDAEEQLQKKIGDIMEEAYEDIKVDNAEIAAKDKEEHVPMAPDDVIDVGAPVIDEVQKLQKAVRNVENYEKMAFVESVKPHDHGLPTLVTAALHSDLMKVEQLILSVQRFFPKEKIYVYDIDLTPKQNTMLSAMCNVRMRSLMLGIFPKFVQNVTNFHWRPLVMHIAMTEFEHITWLNPGFRLRSAAKLLVHYPKAHDTGILVIGPTTGYTTFAVTHPDMYKFIKTDRKKLSLSPHIEIQAIIIHNNDDVREHFMKLLLACAMNPACLAPPGSHTRCDFDFSGRLYAKCHQFDESAINILLKNWFDFEKTKFSIGNCCFNDYNPNERIRPQICKNELDRKTGEL